MLWSASDLSNPHSTAKLSSQPLALKHVLAFILHCLICRRILLFTKSLADHSPYLIFFNHLICFVFYLIVFLWLISKKAFLYQRCTSFFILLGWRCSSFAQYLPHIPKVLGSTKESQNKKKISISFNSYGFAFKDCSLWDRDLVQLIECLPSKHKVLVQCHLNPMWSCMSVI